MTWNTLVVGLFFMVAGMLGLARHYLLEPKIANYPQAPRWLLTIFFYFGAVLIWWGMRYLGAWWDGAPTQPSTVFFALSVLIYKGGLFVNTLRQRLPAHLWARLNRINEIVRCSPRRS